MNYRKVRTYLYVLKNVYRLPDNPTMDDLYKHQNWALKPWCPHEFSLAMDGITDGLDREATIEKATEVINRVFDVGGKLHLCPLQRRRPVPILPGLAMSKGLPEK